MCVRVYVRCVWVAFVGGCFACGCVLERVVFRVRFARVSCPWLRFDVLHEPFVGLRHNAAAAHITLEVVGPHAHVTLFNLLGDLVGVGRVVEHARGGRSLVPGPRRMKHFESRLSASREAEWVDPLA